MNIITPELLSSMQESFASDRAAQIASNAAVKNGVMGAAASYKAIRAIPYSFSVDLDQGDITDQKTSGRCWIFAACNVMRYEMMKKYSLSSLQLSQSYLFFYDKLEKANFYLENMITVADEPVDGRLYAFLTADPICDGGQWEMVANLVRKYGVVPVEAYPDSANATRSRFFDMYLTSLLREDGVKLRNAVNSGTDRDTLTRMKEGFMNEVYRILCISLGEPPRTFDYIVRDKDKKNTYNERGITPREFYEKYIGIDLDSLAGLVNAPADNKPLYSRYTVKFLGNVAEGKRIEYINLPLEKFKAAAVAQLKDGHPVWFGSDVSKFCLSKEGILDRASADVETLFGIHYGFSKGERLVYGDSAMNHAMVLVGVDLDENGRPDRWRVENSWGEDVGHKGFYIASDAWFDEFVYQLVVDRKYLDEESLAVFDKPITELEPWDPLGTLAD